jgi:hypothetical protein
MPMISHHKKVQYMLPARRSKDQGSLAVGLGDGDLEHTMPRDEGCKAGQRLFASRERVGKT